MKKYLLFILVLCAGFSAYAQMATTIENGALISNDERKIHFKSRAKKLYAELDPAKHNKGTNPNADSNNPVQINWISGGWTQDVKTQNLEGYNEVVNGQIVHKDPWYEYTFSDGVGHFRYANVRAGICRVNLFDRLSENGGVLNEYESFVIRTTSISTPRKDQIITYNFNGEHQTNKQSVRYLVQFCDINNDVIHQVCIYSNDVKVIHLKEFFTEEQISNIHAVWLAAGGTWDFLDGEINVAESYFISAYDMNNEDYFKDMDGNYIGNAYIHPSYFICSNNVTLDENTGILSVDEGGQRYDSEILAKGMFNPEENCEYSFNKSVNCVYGNSTVLTEEYADLSDFDRISIRVNDGMPRLFFNTTGHDDEVNHIHIDKSSVIVTDGSSFFSHPDPTWNPDLYQIDLAAIKREYGAVKLNAIKASAWNTEVTISSILIEKLNSLDKPAHIELSVPFSGFDMNDITMVTFDNEEDGDVIWRNIYGYKHFKNVDTSSGSEISLAETNNEYFDCRTLYTSRYNADFLSVGNKEYMDKINNIYWETNYRGSDNPTGKMTVNDICFTKNHVVARNGGNHTKLSGDLFFKYNENNELVLNNEGKPYTGVGLSFTMNQGGNCVFGSSWGIFRELYADLSKFYKMQISGTPKDELVFIFNLDNTFENGSFDQIFAIDDIDNSNKIFVRLDANGLANIDIKDFATRTNNGKFHLNYIAGYNNSEVSINYIKLYGTEDGVVEFNQDMYHTWNRAENGTVTRKNAFGSAYKNNIGNSEQLEPGNTVFGHDYNFVKEDYAELTGYKAIKVTGTPRMKVRVIYNCTRNKLPGWSNENQDPLLNSFQKEKTLELDANGEGILSIGEYVYFHLHGMKVAGGSIPGKIDKVELISDERVDYVLEGNGTLSLTPAEALAKDKGGKNANIGTCAIDAINDIGARVIDARPRVNVSRVSLAYPANPNCLILMRENLSRKQYQRVQFDTPSNNYVPANMVQIGGLPNTDYNNDNDGSITYEISSFNADNITLFDGFPFSAPRDIKYANAQLTRKTTGGKIGTLILPFECEDVNGDAYKTTYAEYAETASKVGKGILGDIMIDANDHVLLYELNEGNAEAYMPYLYVAENSNDATVFNAVADGTITKTPEVGPEDAPAEYMTNNRTDASDRHYLRGFMESTHVENMYGYNSAGELKRAKNATMTPFRVMIQAPIDVNQDAAQQAAAGGVKILLAKFNENDEPTEIKVVDAAELEGIVDVYSVNGALIKKNVKAADAVNSLPKGVYVIGGKKIVK